MTTPRPLRIADLPSVREVPSLTAARMAEVDRVATQELGIALEQLMENAGRQVAAAARAMLGGRVARRRIVVLAGRGNNGGDALVAARHLLDWGAAVTCVVAGAPDALPPVPRRQFDVLAAMLSRPSATSLDAQGGGLRERASLEAELARSDLVLDGLLGYSATGAPRGEVAGLIRLCGQARVPVLAIDVPSGLDPDRGEPLGSAVRATVTVTLALPKAGLLRPAAREFVGELLIADIGIPALAYERFRVDPSALFIDGDLVRVDR